MISHVTIGTTDLNRAMEFYDAALAPLGIHRVPGTKFTGWASWQRAGETGKLWVGKPYNGQSAHQGNGWMVALAAPSRVAVDKAHAAALAAGGTDEGALQTITAPMFAISTATRSISSGVATRKALLKIC